MKTNYSLQTEKIINELKQCGKTPTLLLHSCCAPCSSYVLEYLSEVFKITVFYYNPNISPEEEFIKRTEEQKRLLSEMILKNKPKFILGVYEPSKFYELSKGLENCIEGGKRCELCYRLRLEKTAALAKENGFEYFCSTLSVSPYKNSEKLNHIGEILEKEYNVKYLPSDFKKKNGYMRSIKLSKEYELYRQNYCGCVFSKPI